MTTIPYARQSISAEDIEAVVQVLRSDWLTQGPAVARFEAAVAAYCGSRFAVAVSSGTAALHIACLAAGLSAGKRLWTSPNTFVASANCGRYCDATIDFVDIDPADGNLSASLLEAKLAKAQSEGTLPDVLVPVHYAGHSCDMAAIGALARRHGIVVIEDACHALGGAYRNRAVGACEHSDMAVFSFHPVKTIATAEGGMVLTNSEELYKRLMVLRTHGVTREPSLMEGPSEGGWDYHQIALGFNYRLSDLHAALGVAQMSRIDDFLERRREIARRYDEALRGLPLELPARRADTQSAFHLYPVRIAKRKGGPSRRELFDALHAAGVAVQVHYIPVHTQPYYRRLGFHPGDFPNAEAFYGSVISLPIFPGLTTADQDRVVAALHRLLA